MTRQSTFTHQLLDPRPRTVELIESYDDGEGSGGLRVVAQAASRAPRPGWLFNVFTEAGVIPFSIDNDWGEGPVAALLEILVLGARAKASQ
jgi:hypothetical protein